MAPIHKLINGSAYSLLGVPSQLISADSDSRPVKEVGTSLYLLHLPMQWCQKPEFLFLVLGATLSQKACSFILRNSSSVLNCPLPCVWLLSLDDMPKINLEEVSLGSWFQGFVIPNELCPLSLLLCTFSLFWNSLLLKTIFPSTDLWLTCSSSFFKMTSHKLSLYGGCHPQRTRLLSCSRTIYKILSRLLLSVEIS